MSETTTAISLHIVFWFLLAVLCWLLATWVQHTVSKSKHIVLTMYVVRLVSIWVFSTFALHSVTSFVQTLSNWPLWFLGLSVALAIESVCCFYSTNRNYQENQVISSFADATMLIPRIGMICLLTFLLLEPVLSHEDEHEEQRTIAVLVDNSESMKLSSRSAVDGDNVRRVVAEQLVGKDKYDQNSLLAKLKEDYQVNLYNFGSNAKRVSRKQWYQQISKGTISSNESPQLGIGSLSSTNFLNALEQVGDDLPIDNLSGIIMLSDGCDHSGDNLQQVIRRYMLKNIPVNSVVIGSQIPVRDAQIVAIQAPHQIYFGDSVALRVTVKIDKYKGESVKIRLVEEGKTIEEKTIFINSDRHRQTLLFRHQPDKSRIYEYSVEMDKLPDEESTDNNLREKRIWVSSDHIRLLVIEDRPRWEFRYLRNLFAARDQSVYLQSVLLSPDRLAGVPIPPLMHASSLRAFDDCEATALPETEAEWMKFDVIVLGDVPHKSLGENGSKILEDFVLKRGGTLIVISGKSHMPHTYSQTSLADLLPVKLSKKPPNEVSSLNNSFYLKPTQESESHVIMQQLGTGIKSNASLFPKLSWRHPACEAKAGATVLAYASNQRDSHSTEKKVNQRQNALMLWQRFGAGKVLQLTFDQSWRLRYGIGDKYHHQFWGQMIRWAVEQRLSAGTDLIRLGTDQVLYHDGDKVTIKSKLLNQYRDPITNKPVQANVYLGEELVNQVTMSPRPANDGLLYAEVPAPAQTGKYRIELAGETITQLLDLEQRPDETIQSEFFVESTNTSLEASDIVADSTIPSQLADWTGGIVTTPQNAHAVLETLGPKSTFHRHRWTMPLWNLWPIIVMFLGTVCLEWCIRKSKGLV